MRYAVIALAALVLTGCGESTEEQVAACHLRGIAYFKEIGSYPRLSSGRDASKEALERCQRQPRTAF